MSPDVNEGDLITKLKCPIRCNREELPKESTPRFEVTCAENGALWCESNVKDCYTAAK